MFESYQNSIYLSLEYLLICIFSCFTDLIIQDSTISKLGFLMLYYSSLYIHIEQLKLKAILIHLLTFKNF